MLKDAGHIALVNTGGILKIEAHCTHIMNPIASLLIGGFPPFVALLALSTTAALAVLAACPNDPTDFMAVNMIINVHVVVVLDSCRILLIVVDCLRL